MIDKSQQKRFHSLNYENDRIKSVNNKSVNNKSVNNKSVNNKSVNNKGVYKNLKIDWIDAIFVFGFLMILFGCSPVYDNGSLKTNSAENSSQNDTSGESIPLKKLPQLLFSLTDAPTEDFSSVYVYVDHWEFILSRGGKKARLHLNFSELVDLLTLQNGLLMKISQLEMPPEVEIQQIRLVLNPLGHFALHSNGDVCTMKTPSAAITGIKIIPKTPILLQRGYDYSIVVDFDAKKSVVQQGNGRCLLKPVLRLKEAYRVEQNDDNSGSGGGASGGASGGDGVGTNPTEEPIADGSDSNETSPGTDPDSGFDSSTSSDPTVPDITSDDLETFYPVNF